MLPILGAEISLEVLIAADDDTSEGNIHGDGDGVGSVKTTHAFLADDVVKALGHSQVLA